MSLAVKKVLQASQALAVHISKPSSSVHGKKSHRMMTTTMMARYLLPPLGKLQPWNWRQQRQVTMYQDQESVIDDMVGGMASFAPVFPLKGENVKVLETPSQFLEEVKEGIRNAKERVVLASLYIGTGSLEIELLDVIADALACNPSLQVTLLCDALRTTRPSQESSIDTSSAAMLARVLLSEDASWRKKMWGRSQEQLRIALYHTPQLTETLRWMLPARAREIVGVCHLKAFIFDNTLVLSGANLSTSYFTHRQDRYLCFLNCNQLASHFCSLINIVASFSYTLDMDGKLKPCSVHFDPVREPASFWSEMALSVTELFFPTSEPNVDKGFDTWVFPTVQMGPLGIRQDEEVLLWLLKQMPKGTDIHLSSPYFNLTPAYEAALLEAANDKNVHILTASPKANGFYGSKGISGAIPRAYSLLEQSLYERAQLKNVQQRSQVFDASSTNGLSIYEYERKGWTFHAKGFWCSLPGEEEGPNVTLIGSSNFGYRSRDRDLEAQLWIFSKAPHLRQQLERERDDLYVHSHRVNANVFVGDDRKGGLLASLAVRAVRTWL